MSIDFERELRAGMEQAPIRPRPDVVQAAYRRFRRRWLATRAAVAAGTAVVAGTAATIAVTGLPGPQRIETTAYVVSQVEGALAAENDDVMYVSTSGVDYMEPRGVKFSTQYWSAGDQSREVTIFGGVEQDNWDTVTHVKQGIKDVEVAVDYRQRTATKQTTIIPATTVAEPTSCSGIPVGQPYSPGSGAVENASTLAGYMRALPGCAGVTTTWNQRFDGTEAIKLTGRLDAVTWWVWIDQATFLPIADGFSSTVKTDGSGSDRYEWLPPTQASLAHLTGPIPAGFTVINSPVSDRYIPGSHTDKATLIQPAIRGNGPAATVARRMAAALNATSHEIQVTHQETTGSLAVAQTSTSWIYPGKVHIQGFRGGTLTSDNSWTTTPAGHDRVRQVVISVDYQYRQVQRQDSVGPAGSSTPDFPVPSGVCEMAARGQGPILAGMGYSMEYGAGNSMAIALRDLLACPHVTLAITEHQRFNGTEAIKIVWPDPQQHSSSTFWLDESTYALIGASMAPDPGYHANARMAVAISGSLQMTWLPPTNANFALFNVHVPPGFAEAS